MYKLELNCKLIGKHYLNITGDGGLEFDDSEERTFGNEISAYFISNFSDEFNEYEIQGLCTTEVTFKENLVSFDDLEIGANYLLLTNDDVVLYYEKLTSETKDKTFAVGQLIYEMPKFPTL